MRESFYDYVFMNLFSASLGFPYYGLAEYLIFDFLSDIVLIVFL